MTPEDLIKAKDASVSVAYQRFILSISQYPNDLYCFFEGKDSQYYHLRIKQNYKQNYHYIVCGGKSKVLELYLRLNKEKYGRNHKLSYFIDRDFDISIKDKRRFKNQTQQFIQV